jgi:hypothetical protein
MPNPAANVEARTNDAPRRSAKAEYKVETRFDTYSGENREVIVTPNGDPWLQFTDKEVALDLCEALNQILV